MPKVKIGGIIRAFYEMEISMSENNIEKYINNPIQLTIDMGEKFLEKAKPAGDEEMDEISIIKIIK